MSSGAAAATTPGQADAGGPRIGSLPCADAEAAFGLPAGSLVTSGALFTSNAFTAFEGLPLRLTRFAPELATTQNQTMLAIMSVGAPLFELARGGASYQEHLIFGAWQLFNMHVHYTVVAYVDEETRLIAMADSAAMVSKPTDLALARLLPRRPEGQETVGWSLEGPCFGEWKGYAGQGNYGRILTGFTRMDLDEVLQGCCAPTWLTASRGRFTKGTIEHL